MLVQLLDYTLDVTYQPGAKMHLSDAISRLSTHDNGKGTTIENLDVSIHAIEELTGFNSLTVDKIHQHTSKDQTMQPLIDYINNGFPESSTKCPETKCSNFSFRDELSVSNGEGHNRIIIPESLRSQAINILYNKAHFGLNKMLENACITKLTLVLTRCLKMLECVCIGQASLMPLKTQFQHARHV